MSLPNTLPTMDFGHDGFPFVNWYYSGLSDPATLDFGHTGLPIYAPLAVYIVDAVVITISAGAVPAEIVVVSRKFPNKRPEMVGETQLKQVDPKFGAQYVLYLP